MDPLTHVVVGRAVVAAARDETKNRVVGAAAILGALSPDVDSVLAFSGWDRYVRAHQFGTHSLIGAITMALCAAVVVERVRGRAALSRLRSRESRASYGEARRSAAGAKAAGRPVRPERPHLHEPFSSLLIAAIAGAMSHVVLDLVSGARIAIAWPLSDRRVSLPLVAMADPWLIALCIVWLLMLWPFRVRLRRASRVVVAAATVFLCVKAALLGVALRASAITAAEPSALEARWGSLTGWFVFERLTDAVRASAIAADREGAIVLITRPIAHDSPFVRASRVLEDVQNFFAVHEFTFADETHEDDGRVSVLWSDLRYCWPSAHGEVWRQSTHCGVRIGGVFDASARAIAQEVWIGTVVQRRPAR